MELEMELEMTSRYPMGTSPPSGALYPSSTTPNDGELSRLMTAAVVNRRFCQLLLSNPELALVSGYGGESFRLAAEEQALIVSIRATSLTDFATQLAERQNGNGYIQDRNGHSNGARRKVCGLE